jgi:hypothetical protein
MYQELRKVARLPLEELWIGRRLVSTIKVRDLRPSEIADRLRSGMVRFVIADVGKPLEWIPNNERYDFWKDELQRHLATDDKTMLEDFPGNYCYFASEWKSYDGDTIILLSKAH